MKKLFLITFLSLFITAAKAQFLIGPQVGANFARLTGTGFTVDAKPGWQAGIFMSIPFQDGHFSFMPAVLYELNKFEYDYTTTTVKNTDTTYTEVANINASLGYLNFPFVLNYFTGENKGLMIQAGFQYSLLITDNSTVSTDITLHTTGGDPQTSKPVNENKISFNKSDVAIIGGLGYKFPKLLLVYARVKTGLLKVQNEGYIRDPDRGHNFVIEAGAALCFGAQ